jgi:hypothetical protein
MSFTVELAADQFSVDAGSTVPLTFSVSNTGSEAEQIEVSVEGLDSDWTAIPVPTFQLNPGEKQSEKIFLKPPRISESQAGDYPFVIKIRSLESGESRSLQAILAIKPFHSLSMEISPKKGMYSPTRKENSFELTVMNLGNSEQSLQLFANDPEDELIYTFGQEQIALGPGQTKNVEVLVEPSKTRILATSRLHGFSVGSRGTDNSTLVCTSQAQLEQKAFLSPGNFALLIAILAIFFGWLALIPKPPEMAFLRLSKSEVFAGDTVSVRWNANNASRVRIKLGSETLVDSPEQNGNQEFTASISGIVEAIAIRDGKESETLSAELRVSERPIVPDPKIESFSIVPKSVNKGEKLTIIYRVSESVVKLTLSPPGQLLDPKIDTIFISADVPGSIVYKLVAENSAGKTVTESVTVTVNDPTLPRVDEFKSYPEKVEGEIATVTLSWRTTNAVRIEIIADGERIDVPDATGTRDFTVSKTTEFTITAFDNQGRKEVKKLRVVVKPTATIDPSADPASTTGGGGNPTTRTTGGIRG